MAITRETTVRATSAEIWTSLIDDPNRWPQWLTPVRSLEETVDGSVRGGAEFGVRLGKISGKIRVTEAATGRRLRWQAGPSMMMAMGMAMRGTLDLDPAPNGSTRVRLEMKTPMGPMGAMMMRMMAGLDPNEEMTATITRVKSLAESAGHDPGSAA